ncbi:hypothetical protein D3C78_1644720 [compost metagenome]
MERLETAITELESKKKDIESEMAKEEVFSNAAKLNEINDSYTMVKQKLEQTQKAWEDLAEKIMELEA